ncbi:MAG: HAMP domain-containing histidine kinase [Bacteroidales bacterium]|nr:HAMP domain-containing histidine kinase [Bacteroidales bacterium]
MTKCFVPMILFLLLLVGGSRGEAQEASKFLIDEQTSIQILHEMDSLYMVGDYSKAIENTLILIAYYKNNGDVRGQIVCNNKMGDFLRASGSPTGSLDFLYEAMKLNAQIHDSLLLAQTFNFLAATYFEKDYPKYFDSAEMYASISMDIARRFREEKLEYSDLNILGKVEEGKGNLDGALVFMTQALEIVKRVSPVDETLVLCNIAGTYFLKGNMLKAKELSKKAYDQAKRDNINTYLRLTTALLERIYLYEGNFLEAHRFLGELSLYTRNFLDEKTEERVGAMEAQIRQAEAQAEIRQELYMRKIWTVSLLVLIGLAFLFIIVFARQKLYLRKANRQLIARNEDLRRQQEETRNLTQELQTTNATLKNFISIMAHDLKNPFNTIIGFSDLLNTEYDTLTPEERKLAIENTHKSAQSAFSLLEQLLSWARLQTGSFQLEQNTINLSQLIEEVINHLQTSAFLKKQTLTKQIPEDIQIRADYNMMLAVFRNLISNAIKFTPNGGSIEVSAYESDNTVQIDVKDSGIGIPENGIDKLFSIDKPFKTAGTNGEKGTGIGLLLCKEYLDKNQGTIAVESVSEKGTTFIITLPLAMS